MDSKKRKATKVDKADNPQLAMLELKGQIDYFDDYDSKALRQGRDEKLNRLFKARHD